MAQSNPEPVELDGRTLEGGGQLLRIALCLSALTRTPIKIHNIRGNRSGSRGLKAQHLACVNWLAHASNANVEGAEKGSKTLLFQPGQIQGDLSPAFKKRHDENGNESYECKLEIGTAGSTGLALQAILPFILFTKFPSALPVHLQISGGTNVSGSPSFEYIQHVLLPTLSKIGFPEIKATLGQRGFSQGGGSSIGTFTLEIPPRGLDISLPAFKHAPRDAQVTEPASSLPMLKGVFLAPTSTHDHFRSVVEPALKHHFPNIPSASTEITTIASLHEKRFYFILILTSPKGYIIARDWLYERKIRSLDRTATEMAERVPNDLATEYESGAWVDEHMRDQLVIFQALAHGRSEAFPGRGDDAELREPSLHARTAEWITREMLGKQCRFDQEGCDGVGFGMEEVEGVEEKMEGLGINDGSI